VRTRNLSKMSSVEEDFTIAYNYHWPYDPTRQDVFIEFPGHMSYSYPSNVSSMTDDVLPKKGKKDRKASRSSLLSPSLIQTKDGTLRVTSGRSELVEQVKLPVHTCHHEKTLISPVEGGQLKFTGTFFPGTGAGERQDTYIINSSNPITTYRLLGGSNLSADFANAKYYTAGEFGQPDWFALQDKFNESCDQFIPSSFMLGESIYESAIFIDAFKAIVNPTSVVPTFLKYVSKYVKHARKKKLGHIVKELTKDTANAHLLTIFGVLPAIKDIEDTLSAHKKVQTRIKFLESYAGRFLPIRVRNTIDANVSNSDPVDLPGPYVNFYTHCTRKSTVACIGAWGRVREEFNHLETWKTYLQYFGINKVVGLAWELIPFSFVVDWFTNAQEQINSLTRMNIGGPFTEFRGFSYSKKESLQETLYVSPGQTTLFSEMYTANAPLALAHREVSVFDRYPTIPDTSGVVDSTHLGLFQYAAGLSLLVQRLLR
jgi:hypothetical protein